MPIFARTGGHSRENTAIPPPPKNVTPQLSFIVPTLNERMALPRHLAQFDALPGEDRARLELIVADGGSTDGTPELAEALGTRLARNEGRQTIGANRNVGAAAARGRLLVFCDADTIFEDLPHVLRRIREAFADPGVVGAMPRIRVFPEERIAADRVFHSVYNGAIRWSFRTPAPFGSGQCQVVRRSAFEAVGGYPPEQVHGEDSTLFRRLRRVGHLHYLTDCTIWESPRRYRHYGYARYLGIAAGSLIGQGLLGRNVLREWKRVG
jgi:glycosyltransferase involved in cell wall biosynthesis